MRGSVAGSAPATTLAPTTPGAPYPRARAGTGRSPRWPARGTAPRRTRRPFRGWVSRPSPPPAPAPGPPAGLLRPEGGGIGEREGHEVELSLHGVLVPRALRLQ